MTEKFHQELSELKGNVIVMGRLAMEMLQKSVEALKNQDVELADWVVSKKREIADWDDKIEDEALKLIALNQPMAKDLRTVACILKTITYLARIGRYGKDIAKVVKDLSSQPHINRLVNIPHMSQLVCEMIDDALVAFETEDISKIKDFKERDDNVDSLRYSIFREVVSYMMEDPKFITRGANYAMVARYLERCGDHACKIAEKTRFMVTGERVEIK